MSVKKIEKYAVCFFLSAFVCFSSAWGEGECPQISGSELQGRMWSLLLDGLENEQEKADFEKLLHVFAKSVLTTGGGSFSDVEQFVWSYKLDVSA